jgi:tRNA(fMet)-specific endonuclease VapC
VTYLLDTDIFNHFHAGHPRVVKRVDSVDPSQLAITVMTRIEILQGRFEFLRKASTAEQLKRAQRRLDDSERGLADWNIISFDDADCQHFDRLRGQKGIRKLGRADLLIGCIALAHQAILVTRNRRDFELIQNLKLENWVD